MIMDEMSVVRDQFDRQAAKFSSWLELAKNQAAARNLLEIQLRCGDVENIPFEGSSFSVVVCKSAFHHFLNYKTFFDEMVRCCRNSGRVGIQDIVSYDDGRVND